MNINYNEFKKEIIGNFKEYLEGELIEKVTNEVIDTYIVTLHFDLLEEVESLEEKQYIEGVIKSIIENTFIK